LLEGGLPLGAISEIVGPPCSGHTSFALSFLAGMTQATKVCAWIDVSDALDPESAAAAGVELSRLLWVRCGVTAVSHAKSSPQPAFSLPEKYLVPSQIKKGLHGGGFGPHPRNEAKGLSDAVKWRDGDLRAQCSSISKTWEYTIESSNSPHWKSSNIACNPLNWAAKTWHHTRLLSPK